MCEGTPTASDSAAVRESTPTASEVAATQECTPTASESAGVSASTPTASENSSKPTASVDATAPERASEVEPIDTSTAPGGGETEPPVPGPMTSPVPSVPKPFSRRPKAIVPATVCFKAARARRCVLKPMELFDDALTSEVDEEPLGFYLRRCRKRKRARGGKRARAKSEKKAATESQNSRHRGKRHADDGYDGNQRGKRG